MRKLIINKTSISAFDTFNEEYGEILITLYFFLKKVVINIVDYRESKYAQAANFEKNDAFAYYILDRNSIEDIIYAEIIINEDAINRLALSENEIFAAISHEIGHIIFYFRTDSALLSVEQEEMCCDLYACRINLSESLTSLLNKLIDSGDYSEDQTQLMRKRLDAITFYRCTYDTNLIHTLQV